MNSPYIVKETSASALPNVALIGAGYWGRNHARVLNQIGVLHTLCDSSSCALGKYGEEYAHVQKTDSFEKVLCDPAIAAVVVATPAHVHYQIIKAALLAGKDVLTEKPICLNSNEAAELVELARNKSRILMVGHLLHYHPCVLKIKQLIGAGEIGQVKYIASTRVNMGKFRANENALWSLAPHDISVILSLLGGFSVEHVYCSGASILRSGLIDMALTSLTFDHGVRAHIFVSWLNPFKEQKLTIVGENGMLVFDDTQHWSKKLTIFREPVKFENPSSPLPSGVAGEPVLVNEAEPLLNECRHFLDCRLTRKNPITDGVEALAVLRVLEAAQSSLSNSSTQNVAKEGTKQISKDAAVKSGHVPEEQIFSEKHNIANSSSSIMVHPSAIVDTGATIGRNTRIWHFSHVLPGAEIGECCTLGQNVNVDRGVKIGNNVKIQNNVSVYAGVEIEDDVFLGPSCVLTNVTNPRSQVNRRSLYERTLIRRGATIGANATVVPGVIIGMYAFIAAGAVVTKNVPNYALIVGNPGRRMGWMSRHGHKLAENCSSNSMKCPESGFTYELDSSGQLRCVDYPECEALSPELSNGMQSYEHYKKTIHDERL